MDPQRLPNFFVIGAPKCGTTSLHFYLNAHPEISMSEVKEPHVFSAPRWMARRDDYLGLFDGSTPRCGESSTSYSRYPVEGDAAARIHHAVPDAKVIYLVGDPVERLISDYVQAVAVGVESRSIDEALEEYADPANWYVCASRYATQLRRYLSHFDRSHVLVVEQGDLRHRRRDTLREVFAFLGVDADFWSSRFQPELARREDHVRYQGLGWRLRGSAVGSAFRMLPVGFRLRLSRAVRRRAEPVPRPDLDPELRAELVEVLRPEVEQLRALTGKPLAGWHDFPITGAAAA